MGRERAEPSIDQGSAAVELPCKDSGSPHHHTRAASPSAGKSTSTGREKGHTAQKGEAGSRQGSSTHLFVLGSWWEAGGGMSEVLQCPLQG